MFHSLSSSLALKDFVAMHQCDICLKSFGRRDNMLRHKRSAHSNEDSDEDAMSDVTDQEDIFGSVDENESDNSDDDMSVTSENSSGIDPWQEVVDEAFQECQSQYEEEVREIMQDDTDLSESEAKKDVFEDMRGTYRKALMNSFGAKLMWFDSIKRDTIYKTIKKTVNQLKETEDYDEQEAVKYAILKRRFLFDKVLDSYDVPQLDAEQEEETKQ